MRSPYIRDITRIIRDNGDGRDRNSKALEIYLKKYDEYQKKKEIEFTEYHNCLDNKEAREYGLSFALDYLLFDEKPNNLYKNEIPL